MASKLRLIFGDFLKSLHQLWLEVIGALFLVFGVAFGLHAIQEYRQYLAGNDVTFWALAGAAALSLTTFGFGIHSFWKARKLRQ